MKLSLIVATLLLSLSAMAQFHHGRRYPVPRPMPRPMPRCTILRIDNWQQIHNRYFGVRDYRGFCTAMDMCMREIAYRRLYNQRCVEPRGQW